MIIYKDILLKLKVAGYSTTRLRRENLLTESTLTRIRNNSPISVETLDVICRLTQLQPGDLLEYYEDSLN